VPKAPVPRAPYVELDRPAWAALRAATPLTLTDADIARMQSLGDVVDSAEVEDVILPLSRLLNLQVKAARDRRSATAAFLGESDSRSPFVIGIAGSVAVGKSTIARLLGELLARWPQHPEVALVTTDGFLLPNAELERRGLLERKGFPASYDRRALLRFLVAVTSGVAGVMAPVYSHLAYDVVPDEAVAVNSPDVLILEGLNVLQPPPLPADGQPSLAVSDFFDFSVYVDAAAEDIERWYIERFLRLRETAFADPVSYFHRYAALDDDRARATAHDIWHRINEPNLVENILPTRERASLVLEKGPDHAVRHVRVRRT